MSLPVSENGKIKVRVTAYSRVEYSQTREITPEQFAEYGRIIEKETGRNVDRQLHLLADRFINPTDICDAGDYEDVEIVRVDDKGINLRTSHDQT